MRPNLSFSYALSLSLALLAGCATQPNDGQTLEAANRSFQAVKEDPDVLRSAPKDVIRAGESLGRLIARVGDVLAATELQLPAYSCGERTRSALGASRGTAGDAGVASR